MSCHYTTMSKIDMDFIEKCHIGSVLAPPSEISEKQKFFVTFPYPYMNGRLHLGHGYTIMGAEMMARFYKSKGYNVMFPFGFHGSGMPIVACAKKLHRELTESKFSHSVESEFSKYVGSCTKDSQIGILRDMGVDITDIPKFVDPTFWILYFSEKAKEDLKDFHAYTDFTRSFYTTDMNPYYDSFVRWQFDNLIKLGHVYKGKRDVIFSLADNQPCADHDRHSSGEGVKPATTSIKIIPSAIGNIMVTICDPNGTKIVSNCKKLTMFKMNEQTYVSNEWAYKNIIHQYNDITFIGNTVTDINDIEIMYSDIETDFGTGFYLVSDDCIAFRNHIEVKCDFKFSEPEKQVVSRSGDICIVAKSDQWFINYGDEHIKRKIHDYVTSEFKTTNKIVKDMFITAIDWLNEWACSRNFGLGTYIEGTSDIIDSLSDSTIYMAYYTVAHLVTKIPAEHVTKEMWNSVFYDFPVDDNEYKPIIEQMKQEFRYWYPLDLRVSGKDLVNNHLTMSLFNHYMIWKDEKYLPKSFNINGYLMLDGKKMSKSEGNFMTLRGAIDTFGVNATRFVLATSDGIEDGNFDCELAKNISDKLMKELNWISECIEARHFSREKVCVPVLESEEAGEIESKYADLYGACYRPDDEYDIWDKIFSSDINNCIKMAHDSYSSANYSYVIKQFYALISARDNNKKNKYLCNNRIVDIKWSIVKKYCEALITIMYPICPTWTHEIQNMFEKISEPICHNWTIEGTNMKYYYYKDILSSITNECFSTMEKLRKQGKSEFSFEITIFNNFTSDELLVIKNIDHFDEFISTIDKKSQWKSKAFMAHIKKMTEKYGTEWISWFIPEENEEYRILNNNISKMIRCNCVVKMEEVSTIPKKGPGFPFVECKFV